MTIHLRHGKGVDMDGWESLVEATIDAIRVDSENKEVRIEVTCAWCCLSRYPTAALSRSFVR